jgi:hypothetical protein
MQWREERKRRKNEKGKIYYAASLKPPMEPNGDRNTSNALYLVNATVIAVSRTDTRA